MDSFQEFNNDYIKFEKNILKDDNINHKVSKKYDCFVAGSDQIWNPDYKLLSSPCSFLSFVEGKKKVAVAASFGVDAIKEQQTKTQYMKLLNNMDAISVREESGVDIVKELIDKEVPRIIDPTFMLSKEEWLKIAKKPKFIGTEEYIFSYFLGSHSNEEMIQLEEYAKKEQYRLIVLEGDTCQMGVCSENEFVVNPSEFVWLVHNAKKVITDSFHAIAFSLIFKKEFVSIPRNVWKSDMSTRMLNIARMFDIENIISSECNFEERAIVDYDIYSKHLLIEQEKFYTFINDNIG